MINVNTLRKIRYSPSREWLARKLSNPKRDRDLRDCVAKMKPSWQAAVFGFTTEYHASSSPSRWTFYHIELSQRPSKTRLPGHNQNDPLIQVIFCARFDDMVRVGFDGGHGGGHGGGFPIPPHYWQQMHQDMQRQQEMQRQEMQRRGMHMQGHGEHRQWPPSPPYHGHHGGGGGRGGADPRIVTIGPGRGHGGGHGGGQDEDGSDESERGGHHDDRRGRARRGRHENFAHGGGYGGHHRHGEQEYLMEIIKPDLEDARLPRRTARSHGQRWPSDWPSEFRPRSRSRSRPHKSHSRSRNHSWMGPRQTPLRHRIPSRHRRNYYSDDSDDSSEYGRSRIIRPSARFQVTGGRPRMGDKIMKRVSETKQSDAEIIDQLLREYTTFGDGNPSAPVLTTTNNEPGPTSSPIDQASMNGRANAADGTSDAS